MATVGGFASDYDLMPTGEESDAPLQSSKPIVYQDSHEGAGNACPSFVWATREGYEAWIDYVLGFPDGHSFDTINGKPHGSDMYFWRTFVASGGGEVDPQVWQYGEPGWQNAPLVHFSRGSTHGQGITPRWSNIPRLLEEAKRFRNTK